jgi:HAD superfamily hydrolase (TIGR01490 family)
MFQRAAFFDVDETLIGVVSLFRFLCYDMAMRGLPSRNYDAAMDNLRSLKATGASREDANRAFYRIFAGRRASEVAAQGEGWFRVECRSSELFNLRVLTAFWAHARADDLTVLVSGSFPPCLDPIARFVGAEVVLCSRPEIRQGRYTGEIIEPMVDRSKAAAVAAAAAEHGIALKDCFPYGDHASDLPMMSLVCCPVVIGEDPMLIARATELGWPRLPSWKRRNKPRNQLLERDPILRRSQ